MPSLFPFSFRCLSTFSIRVLIAFCVSFLLILPLTRTIALSILYSSIITIPFYKVVFKMVNSLNHHRRSLDYFDKKRWIYR